MVIQWFNAPSWSIAWHDLVAILVNFRFLEESHFLNKNVSFSCIIILELALIFKYCNYTSVIFYYFKVNHAIHFVTVMIDISNYNREIHKQEDCCLGIVVSLADTRTSRINITYFCEPLVLFWIRFVLVTHVFRHIQANYYVYYWQLICNYLVITIETIYRSDFSDISSFDHWMLIGAKYLENNL